MHSVIVNIWELIENGGIVLPPLLLLSATLFFAIGERLFVLRSSRRQSMRKIYLNFRSGNRNHQGSMSLHCLPTGTLWQQAAAFALLEEQKYRDYVAKTAMNLNSQDILRDRLDVAFSTLITISARHRVLIRTLVGLAPLLGLLGTVHGMIETFSSMGEMNMYAQSGGIAGGVSEALLSTQVGLVIAVPGILLGRTLDRKEKRFLAELEELKDLTCHSSRSST